ncbi:hypothetical protein ABN763_10130 [Spongiivirga sp. MCCC 1A20706]|uniref:hypothetical protein n=1 Tax=Spongiivirga sp. MCCC 1A20706 TaxID=3160963 RepID=UPI00397752F4
MVKRTILPFFTLLILTCCTDDTTIEIPSEEESIPVVSTNPNDIDFIGFENIAWVKQGDDFEGLNFLSSEHSMDLNNTGNKIILGSKAKPNSCVNFCSGRIRVFAFETEEWTQTNQDIYGDINVEPNWAGYDVAMSDDGSTIAVSYDSTEEFFRDGLTRVFRNDNSSWVQLGQDIPFRTSQGSSIALNKKGNILVVLRFSSGNNSLRVFKLSENENWEQLGEEILVFLDMRHAELNSEGDVLIIGNDEGSFVEIYDVTDEGLMLNQEIRELNLEAFSSDLDLSANGKNFIVEGVATRRPTFARADEPFFRVYHKTAAGWVQKGQEIRLTPKNEGDIIIREQAVTINKFGNLIAVAYREGTPGSPHVPSKKHVVIFQYFNSDEQWKQVSTIQEEGFLKKIHDLDFNDDGDIIGIVFEGGSSVYKIELVEESN